MANFNYILSYDPLTSAPTWEQLQVFITQNRDIESWYLAFAGTYILRSNKAFADFNPQFVQFFKPSPFMLTWICPGYTTGWLPPAVWEWMASEPNRALAGS